MFSHTGPETIEVNKRDAGKKVSFFSFGAVFDRSRVIMGDVVS